MSKDCTHSNGSIFADIATFNSFKSKRDYTTYIIIFGVKLVDVRQGLV
jgi:hypothetical protein